MDPPFPPRDFPRIPLNPGNSLGNSFGNFPPPPRSPEWGLDFGVPPGAAKFCIWGGSGPPSRVNKAPYGKRCSFLVTLEREKPGIWDGRRELGILGVPKMSRGPCSSGSLAASSGSARNLFNRRTLPGRCRGIPVPQAATSGPPGSYFRSPLPLSRQESRQCFSYLD